HGYAAEAGGHLGGGAPVERNGEVDRQELLVDAERVVQHAEAVAHVVVDVAPREIVSVARGDGGRVGEEGARQRAHGGEVQQVPVELGDVVVAQLQAPDHARARQQLVGREAAQAGRPARAHELAGQADVAAGGGGVDVDAQHVSGQKLEQPQR